MPDLSTMDPDLRYFLLEGGGTVKNLQRLTGRSATWVRENLKKFQAQVRCRKTTDGKNHFWLEPETEPVDSTIEETPTAIQEDVAAPAEDPDTPRCPSCQSTDVVAAGEPGSFLGAALTCQGCGKTHNAINGKEITVMAQRTKAKRVILNPQYKIRAKTEAVEKAGGTLRFDKADRRWVLVMKNGDTLSMTAEQFSIETPETLVKKVG